MSDGREHLRHRPDCPGENLVVQRARIACTGCDRYAPRTDVAPGVCRDCGGNCRPDMPMCSRCLTASRLRTTEATITPTKTTPVPIPTATPPRQTARLACRGCYRPVMVKVKPGGGFICTCSIGRAA